MADTYAACLDFTLRAEGGWADDPADPGGCTMHGITLPVFREWQHDPTLGCDDLRTVTATQVQAFYYNKFWLPTQAQQLPLGVDLMVMDAAVNIGVSRSLRLLQGCVHVPMDGQIGPITLAAVAEADPMPLIDDLAEAQASYYRGLSGFAVFGTGWLNRLEARHSAALQFQRVV